MSKEIEVRENSLLIGKEWYDAMIEECSSIITEASEASRWALVEGYHQLGTRILEDKNKFKSMGINDDTMTQRVASSLGKSIRTIQQAIQFATMFPDVEQVPGGKGVSWNKICNKVLIGKSIETSECLHAHLVKVCADCGRRIK